ncbi:hypothetical protein [Streptomyces sp. NPDC057280]|uniref:hypothetical protein n=1 Tax=Streptomyces sp. NPDC057280 TaxID=3346081 RepID=UPI0009A33D30|nr:hypothetical protein B1R27_30705 [Streptomyces sp. GKU 895]
MQASQNGDEISFAPVDVETQQAGDLPQPLAPPTENATMFRSPEGKYSAVEIDQTPQPANPSADDNLADLHLNEQGGGLPDLTAASTARTWTWSDTGQWVAGHSAHILSTVNHAANLAGTGLSAAAAWAPKPALATAAAVMPVIGAGVTLTNAVTHFVTLRDGRTGDTPEQTKVINATNRQLYVNTGLMTLGAVLQGAAAGANAQAESHAATLPATTAAALKGSATIAAGVGTLLVGIGEASNANIPTFRTVLPVPYVNDSPVEGSMASLNQGQQPNTFTVAGAAEAGQTNLRHRPRKEAEIFQPAPAAPGAGTSSQKPRR